MSEALFESEVMADPVTEDWSTIGLTLTVLVVVHVKLAEEAKPAPSVAVMVTEALPGVVGVPVTAPVAALIDRPAGRPVADQVRVAPDWVSEALFESEVMAEPVTEDWAPGFVTETVFVVVHVKFVVP